MTLEVVDESMITTWSSQNDDAASGAFQVCVRLEQHVQVPSLEARLVEIEPEALSVESDECGQFQVNRNLFTEFLWLLSATPSMYGEGRKQAT